MNSNFYKIEGEQAKAIATVEAEMDKLQESTEKQYAMLQDQMKDVLYGALSMSRDEGDAKMWTLVAKYYPQFGFYMAELEDKLFPPELADSKQFDNIKPTKH